MGLIQRRRLFHIIFGCLALLCLLFAFQMKKAPHSSSSLNNPETASTSAIEQQAQNENANANAESSKLTLANNNQKETQKEIGKDAKDNASIDNSVAANASKDEKSAKQKQTIMTLADVKKADRNTATVEPSLKSKTKSDANSDNTNTDSVSAKEKGNVKESENKTESKGKEQARQECDTVKVRKGDSLTKIFKREGYSQKDLEALMSSDLKTSKKFKNLQVKQTLKIYYAQNNQVQALALESSKGKFIQLGKISPIQIAKKDKENSIPETVSASKSSNIAMIDKQDKQDKLETALDKKSAGVKDTALNDTNNKANNPNLEKKINFGKGTVKDSLYLAGKRAGLDKAVVSQLVDIFGWSIDFALIQPSDSFKVLYEEKCLEGEKVGTGPILAAEMTYKGKVLRVVRYTDKSGHTSYFTPEGFGMKETFSRYPLAFSHVSSGFGNRTHPIRHKMRKHTGVDFAAPRGTPVKCTGDGKVIFAGTRGGYGRVIEIQHGQKYSTLYAHLLKFAPKLKVGDTVKKGQEIGNVGRTGLATGNHLHYEFRVDGVHKDPLTITLPKKSPIPDGQKRHFMAHAKDILKLMNEHENKINMVRNEYPRNE